MGENPEDGLFIHVLFIQYIRMLYLYYSATALNASSRSWMISSIFSVPMERRIVFGLIPDREVLLLCTGCVLSLPGWITRDFTSATLASRENSSRLSMKSFAFCASPLISKVKMEPPPFGKYFAYSACCSGSSDTDGWWTFSTCGWLFKYWTTFSAFSTWRSTRSDSVSSPEGKWMSLPERWLHLYHEEELHESL